MFLVFIMLSIDPCLIQKGPHTTSCTSLIDFFWLTSTSITGCGTMFFPPPLLCHFWSSEVQASVGLWSSSWQRSFVDLQSYRVYLQIFNISANTWLQYPTLPATHEEEALATPPLTIHKAIFNVCGGSFFRKLFQHLAWKKKYRWSLVAWISWRYSSTRKVFAFLVPVGT